MEWTQTHIAEVQKHLEHPVFRGLSPCFETPYASIDSNLATADFGDLKPQDMITIWQDTSLPIAERACAFDLYARLQAGQTQLYDEVTPCFHVTGFDTLHMKILPHSRMLIMVSNSTGRANYTCNGKPGLYLLQSSEQPSAVIHEVIEGKNEGGKVDYIQVEPPISDRIETRQRGSQTDNLYIDNVIKRLQSSPKGLFILEKIQEVAEGNTEAIQKIIAYDATERVIQTILGTACNVSNFHLYSREWSDYMSGADSTQQHLIAVQAAGHKMIDKELITDESGMPDYDNIFKNVLQNAPLTAEQRERLEFLSSQYPVLYEIICRQYFDFTPLQYMLRPERFDTLSNYLHAHPHFQDNPSAPYMIKAMIQKLEEVYTQELIQDAETGSKNTTVAAITLEPNGPNERFVIVTKPTTLITSDDRALNVQWGIHKHLSHKLQDVVVL